VDLDYVVPGFNLGFDFTFSLLGCANAWFLDKFSRRIQVWSKEQIISDFVS
jgi:hypothetical protein